MKTCKYLLTAFLLALALPLAAQNNPYNINDECYSYYEKAESIVGQPGFDKVNEALLSSAIANGDTKAQTLYYVGRMKNLTRILVAKKTTTEAEDEKVLKYMAELQEVALKLGYKQYYYYASELAQNHFYNHGKFERTMELAESMLLEAINMDDEYGKWVSMRYMVARYFAQTDYLSARKYIQDALKIYNTSSDPTIRRQSPSRLYCDLADTYPIGSDSVHICLRHAIDGSKHHLDTLRWKYHVAKLAAYNRNIEAYEEARDYCLRDPNVAAQISNTTALLFRNIDAIVYDQGVDKVSIDSMFMHLREVKFIANIAEEYGYKDKAFEIEKQLVAIHEQKLSDQNRARLSEFDARMGNDRLHADLTRKESEINHLITALAVAAFLILAVIVILQIVHSRALERRNRELMEANEKVLVANAAKTRFVQNMSHEVRTPLNAIVGFSQLLTLPDGTFSPEEKDDFSSHIVNNTKMLTMLLDDILNTSSMDSGTYTISYEEGECNFICEAAISSAEHRLQPGVTMEYLGGIPRPFSIWTDPRRVQQILINLLTNSCKHTSKGWIHLASSLDENPGFVTFSVTDTGPGVPAYQAEAIFERFTKLNEFVQGTGLGLSICRDIASRMDARVYLDTHYTEGGARFVFVVPVKQAPEKPSNL